LLRSSLAVALVLGLWFIWADMIPALSVLDHVKISETVVAVPFGDDGKPLAQPRQLPVSITLQDLIVALLISCITLGAVRNLPGLLEMTLLTRLKMPAGERHAVTTILKYAITILGVILAFNQLGIGWSKVQWLVAALGLGLAFGLQEIFANFVSGIIILFERPIRVGDVVTIGEISGTVSKIRIRATTITDFDRKELIVPNKHFVTGQVINWTRGDSVLRIIVPIRIAYGSDTKKAVSLLHRVASECELVLKDPAPQVFFAGFGDSWLNFELRAFCNGVDDLLPARHSLHMTIERAFREAGIEIAGLQREATPSEAPQKAATAPLEPVPSQKKA
jgi:small-conductance mechanosensitive channel